MLIVEIKSRSRIVLLRGGCGSGDWGAVTSMRQHNPDFPATVPKTPAKKSLTSSHH